MNIRTFNLDMDYNAVRHLWELAGPGVQLSPSDERVEIARKLQRDPDLFLVLEDQDEIVGVVFGGYDGRRGSVYHLAVHPDRRGEGFGKALMIEIEQRLQSKGCYKYYLLVRKESERVLDFYRALGCEEMDLHILGKVLR